MYNILYIIYNNLTKYFCVVYNFYVKNKKHK